MQADTSSDLAQSWWHRDPSTWGNLAGWRRPDEGTVLLIEGGPSDDGLTWDSPLFPVGALDVTIAILSADQAQQAYALTTRFMASRQRHALCVEENNGHVCARWNLTDGEAVILVGDARGYRHAQDELLQVLEKLKVPFASRSRVGQYLSFSGDVDDQIDDGLQDKLREVHAPRRSRKLPGLG